MRRVLAAVAAMLALGAAQKLSAQAIITNGLIGLGVDRNGQLNIPGPGAHWGAAGPDNYGLRYLPTNGEATADGCPCEGWGAAYDHVASGSADNALGTFGVANVGFAATASTAVTKSMVGGLMVTQDFHLSGTPNLYEVTVTLTNLSGAAMGDVRYTRLMDWDIEPTPFDEVVELGGFGSAANLLYMTDDGFNSPDPYAFRSTICSPANTNGVTGPCDHGGSFDLGFGGLADGASVSFNMYYGAGKNYAEIRAALAAEAVEAYSIAWCDAGSGNPDCRGTDGPNVFGWGFAGIGGTPVLSPEPSTYALFGTGLVGLLALRRRRRA